MGYSGAHMDVLVLLDQLKYQVVRSPEKGMVDSQLWVYSLDYTVCRKVFQRMSCTCFLQSTLLNWQGYFKQFTNRLKVTSKGTLFHYLVNKSSERRLYSTVSRIYRL